ncbi:transcription factor TFIIH complex subunit Tfb5-domain-containing protein [Pseudomassariella vexata]|uniref:General transcription and DNA repair factor IIH subunit TFB5 n=1 Tax=Pseudomassariella vexata TaxID=1141098 RepID=A0A1Y2E1C9_9PEZI|nr:transcription factor TFIIH complex subunit Tfb5-domain-containing protein [Pseudomassariella vexata]ORY65342.1 transcription factor TFIIH complex subunit Tfb5-domain-containing protein [Pseudomassariella vexata]
MPRAIRGVLIECDPSIKSIIMNINESEANAYVIEDLDDSHLVVQESKVQDLKRRLDDHLKETIPEIDRDSDSDRDVKQDKKGW